MAAELLRERPRWKRWHAMRERGTKEAEERSRRGSAFNVWRGWQEGSKRRQQSGPLSMVAMGSATSGLIGRLPAARALPKSQDGCEERTSSLSAICSDMGCWVKGKGGAECEAKPKGGPKVGQGARFCAERARGQDMVLRWIGARPVAARERGMRRSGRARAEGCDAVLCPAPME